MAKTYVPIKDWPEDERPRERLLRLGVAALSDAELLAILLGTGTKDTSAIELAYKILHLASGNLFELGKLNMNLLMDIPGIGQAKAMTLLAAFELGKRRQYTDALDKPIIGHSRAAADIIIPLIGDLPYEAFCVLYINQGNRVIQHELISKGGITGTVADTRIILQQALMCHATQLIVGHNHPSGNIQPSVADRRLTEKLKNAASYMDITLLDHLIVSGGGK